MSVEVFEELVDALRRELVAQKMPTSRAAEVSVQVVANVCGQIGGQSMYLPRRPPWIDRSLRDRAIRAEFNGRNLEEVCRRFRVSRSTVYRAVRSN